MPTFGSLPIGAVFDLPEWGILGIGETKISATHSRSASGEIGSIDASREVVHASESTCGFAWPGTYGHECGKPAVVAAPKPSALTLSGVFWAARCETCRQIKGGENAGLSQWETLDLTRHRNVWKR